MQMMMMRRKMKEVEIDEVLEFVAENVPEGQVLKVTIARKRAQTLMKSARCIGSLAMAQLVWCGHVHHLWM